MNFPPVIALKTLLSHGTIGANTIACPGVNRPATMAWQTISALVHGIALLSGEGWEPQNSFPPHDPRTKKRRR